MNRIETIIVKILAVLYSMPDGQCSHGVLKSSVDLLVKPNTLHSEFEEAIKLAETNNWVLGVRPRLGSVKWTITDPGRAEYLQSSK